MSTDNLGGRMAISRDEVIFAYRLLLDRFPESESVISGHTQTKSLAALRDSILQSPEYLSKVRERPAQHLSLSAPQMLIDTEAGDADIIRCVAKIKKAWTHLGQVQPYFSVLTSPQFLPGNIASSLREFWKTGDIEADDVEQVVLRYGCEELATKVCVEFGCGVGRVTTGLARKCAAVHAYDLSSTHLAYAVKRAQDTSVSNIVFHQCADNLLETIHPCDLFYSRIVFQHNPPVIISRLIRNALKCLNPGGLALFQVPTYELGYRFKTAEWLAAEHALDMQMHCLPQAHIFEIAVRENCAVLEVREDGWAGPSDVRISNSFVIRKAQ